MPAGRPDVYSNYIAALDNECLYSAEGVVRHARELGLFPENLSEEEESEHFKAACHAIIMRARRKLLKTSEGKPLPADGTDRTNPGNPKDAFLGLRWKATIPDRFLEDIDVPLVRRFRDDKRFEKVFVKDHGQDRGFSWKNLEAEDAKESTGRTLSSWIRWGLSVTLIMVAFFLWTNHHDPLRRIDQLWQQHDLKQLRALLDQKDFAEYRPLILQAISDSHLHLDLPVFTAQDLSQLSAVFSFDKQPMLMFDQWIVQPGDRLTIASEPGYVSEINRESFILKTDWGSREFTYPECLVFGNTSWRRSNVIIYPAHDNMNRVLQAICRVSDFEMDGGASHGRISGLFECTDYSAFIRLVATDLELEIVKDTLKLRPLPPDQLRSVIGFGKCFPFLELTVDQALVGYEQLLYLNFIFPESFADTKVTLPPTQFHQFIDEMHFKLEMLGPNLVKIGEYQ